MAETARLTAEGKAERDKIVAALMAAEYSPAHAADAIGMSRATMGRRVKAYGLDEWLEQNNQRLRRRRQNRGLPPAPHEPSRQAQDQAAHRAAGRCKCGRPPVPKSNGKPGRWCERCREVAREQKKKQGSVVSACAKPSHRS